jgi:hypothetical protein
MALLIKVQMWSRRKSRPKDDFGYWIDTKSRKFFTSNRDGGQGFDDIYKFLELRKPILCRCMVTDVEPM